MCLDSAGIPANRMFTFHYVSILISSPRAVVIALSQVYIPLCLYFNSSARLHGRISLKFTFHYVSILISFVITPSEAVRKFTFHYVSILMVARSVHPPSLLPFTFHYVSILMCGGACHVYLSLMFTFHYVSILIDCFLDTPVKL